ncbi:hypothetical protein BGZ60DRAFT_385438 [Tricladium varicosporioides]|nr:hypothetical protein BGZ60DRAFT_385438 [Hymenoscyphus varicosporioides]
MSASLVGHLARRGMEVAVKSNPEKHPYKLPIWGAVMLGGTVLAFLLVLSMVEYTFGRLVPTLVMIESPQDAIVFEPLPTDDPDTTINKNPELEAVKPKPITSSFRTTIQLLQSKGGFRARFRGISIFIVTQILLSWIANLVSIIPGIPKPVGMIVASVALAQLLTAWTHIVISDPSPKTWFRRLPAKSTWKKIAIPTAITALAEQVALYVPIYVGLASGLNIDPEQAANLSSHEQKIIALKGFGIFVLALVLGFLLVIPSNVTLTRVQASLLSDTEETIVPFDRSFKGKVIPEIVGGSGVVGMLDAWKTFDWSARIRLIKAYAKVFCMQFALGALFTAVIFFQIFIIVGKDFKKIIEHDGKNGQANFTF